MRESSVWSVTIVLPASDDRGGRGIILLSSSISWIRKGGKKTERIVPWSRSRGIARIRAAAQVEQTPALFAAGETSRAHNGASSEPDATATNPLVFFRFA